MVPVSERVVRAAEQVGRFRVRRSRRETASQFGDGFIDPAGRQHVFRRISEAGSRGGNQQEENQQNSGSASGHLILDLRSVADWLAVGGTDRNHVPGGEAACYFNLRQIGKGSLHIPAFEFVADNLQHVWFGVVHSNRLSWHYQHVVVLGGDDCYPDVYIRQEFQILVIYDAGRLADVARAAQLHCRWDGGHGGAPNASRNGVPRNLHWISGSQPAHIGFVDKSADQHFSQIRHLQQKISGGDEATLLGGQRVHNATKRGANIRFRQDILSGIVGGLRFSLLCFDAR